MMMMMMMICSVCFCDRVWTWVAGGLIDSQAAPASTAPVLVAHSRGKEAGEEEDEEEGPDDMLLEMLSADQSGMDYGDASGRGEGGEDGGSGADASANDEDEDKYDVYDALRKEERNRNSMMRFKIQK